MYESPQVLGSPQPASKIRVFAASNDGAMAFVADSGNLRTCRGLRADSVEKLWTTSAWDLGLVRIVLFFQNDIA